MANRSDYTPIPVEEARNIAIVYHKDCVVVIAVDHAQKLTHCTTYGKSPSDKAASAFLGERCMSAIGCELSKSETFEDFRTKTAAEAAKEIETITEKAESLANAIRRISLLMPDRLKEINQILGELHLKGDISCPDPSRSPIRTKSS